MAGAQGAALAIAVCNAGGLGALPCALLTHEAIRGELETIRRGTTRPINVNFFCHEPPKVDPAAQRAWIERLAPYYREVGLQPPIDAGPGRAAFDAAAAELLE